MSGESASFGKETGWFSKVFGGSVVLVSVFFVLLGGSALLTPPVATAQDLEPGDVFDAGIGSADYGVTAENRTNIVDERPSFRSSVSAWVRSDPEVRPRDYVEFPF